MTAKAIIHNHLNNAMIEAGIDSLSEIRHTRLEFANWLEKKIQRKS